MLESPKQWADAFADLPLAEDASWTQDFASLIDELTTGKLTVSLVTPPPQFQFNKSIFQSGLQTVIAAPPPQPQTQMATAWLQAILASQITISAGASIGAPSPATTFSAPPIALIEPTSATAASQVLLSALLASAPVEDPAVSTVPSAFRTAFMTLLATATGVNSAAPPTPLVLPPTPLS